MTINHILLLPGLMLSIINLFRQHYQIGVKLFYDYPKLLQSEISFKKCRTLTNIFPKESLPFPDLKR